MENLNKIMSAKKVSSKDLALMTGLPKQSIDAYRRLKNPRMPSFEVGMRIADALGDLLQRDIAQIQCRSEKQTGVIRRHDADHLRCKDIKKDCGACHYKHSQIDRQHG